MLHVDVRTVKDTGDVIIETSTDGGPWGRQGTFPPQVDDTPQDLDNRVRDAEGLARWFIAGARYAGATCKGTSHGYAL